MRGNENRGPGERSFGCADGIALLGDLCAVTCVVGSKRFEVANSGTGFFSLSTNFSWCLCLD